MQTRNTIILKPMIVALILVAIAACRPFGASAQSMMITLPVKELSAREVFQIIESQTSYKFMINQSSLKSSMTVKVTQPSMSMTSLLDKLFSGTGFTYAVDGKYIVVPVEATAVPLRTEIVVRTVEPKGHVLGIVTDSRTKKGVAGAHVILVETAHRTVTDEMGRFELRELRPDNYAVKLHIPQLDTVIYRELIVREGTTTQQDLTVTLPGNAVLSSSVTIIPADRNRQAADVATPDENAYKYTYVAVEPASDVKSYRPKAALKVDLPYLAAMAPTVSPNISLELGLGRRWTLDISAGVGKIGGDGEGIRHVLVRPELRYWFGIAFERHFVGLQAMYGKYRIADMDIPLFKNFSGKRYEGWGAGAGLVYGYHLPVSTRWAFEFSVGAGYLWLDYKDFESDKSDSYKWNEDKHYFGLTKASISLVFMIK